ncbi:YiiX/YebB-like N1pC/P60 family cysteine hydrolase [uncultured Lutibacter sp.]|uniref:YiiX/YebB-like N1pC/P60 family cysteine hydrolase n=1 Tax=uncultured Lutibacter sp. TaxID=437739 RepID=UPI0026167C3E|nr:YiiX/YebB-like N1pC/P60 family cysteine hydrolase [uncultured Lutibacter sp.]
MHIVVLLFLFSTEFIFSQSNEFLFNTLSKIEVKESGVTNNYANYLNLLDNHQLLQNELIDSSNYFKKIRNKKYVLNGNDIKVINQSFSKRIELLKQSVNFPEIEENLDENLHLNNLIATHLKIKSLETFVTQQNIVGQNATINNLINEENGLYHQDKKSLKKIKRIIISRKFRKSILETWNNSKGSNDNILNETIIKKIEATSYYQNFLSNDKNIKSSKKYFRKLIDKKSTFNAEVNFNNFLNNISSGVSNVVSNFMGIFASRKGKLINNEDFINNSLHLLQPLDVVLEKTPFRLTDRFIPGYWGHAAIYIGNEIQLKKLGVWEHPFVEKYHEEILQGKFIVEALRSKVACNTFKRFSNIDDYAQLRLIKEPSLAKKREMIVRVFAQIGKKYDFGYDVESSKKIICSELHYITYDEIVFNTDRFFGINTITVDHVAEQALKGGAFYPVDLYLDGIRIEDGKIFEIYDQLPTSKNKELKKLKRSLHQ